MISFQARRINTATVMHLNPRTQQYESAKAYFVKLSPFSENDLQSLHDANNMWKEKSHYLPGIYGHFTDWTDDIQDKFFYALTTQDKKIKKLDPSQILGFVELADRGLRCRHVNYMETVPVYSHDYEGVREYKGVGTGMIKSLMKMPLLQKLSLTPNSLKVIDFYEKTGMKPDGGIDLVYTKPLYNFVKKLVKYLITEMTDDFF